MYRLCLPYSPSTGGLGAKGFWAIVHRAGEAIAQLLVYLSGATKNGRSDCATIPLPTNLRGNAEREKTIVQLFSELSGQHRAVETIVQHFLANYLGNAEREKKNGRATLQLTIWAT